MAFAVICKGCQARFLLNDDLVRRKVAGRVVTVRCRQCHATIEVDASDMDPTTLPETSVAASSAPAPPPAKPKGSRPAPAPPRPTAKSTLMGIGAQRAAGATELVALSPGLLDVRPAPATAPSPHGFPEPPPPPGAIEVLDPVDWEIEGPAPAAEDDAAPESVDDFAEELPPSIPPEDEMPSSTGTPSLQALTHLDEQANKPRVDDFLANMTAAMNGGIMMGAPTIDVSELAPTPPPVTSAPSIDVSKVDAPARGAKTLPLFSSGDGGKEEALPSRPVDPVAISVAEGSLSPAALDRPAPQKPQRVEGARERKNVVAPATKSVPPAAAARRASGLAAPMLLALAAVVGFLIWKRSAANPPPEPIAEAERPVERAVAEPPAAPVALAPTAPAEPAASQGANAVLVDDDITFETVPTKAHTFDKPTVASPAGPAAPQAATEPKPEPAAPANEETATEPTPPAEPAGPFDRAAAAAALTSSAGQASACRKEGDPSGVASVVVTFAPSGRVTSASISGPPFAGTPTGGCIASALRKTRIPAFDGDRVTVSKTVVIQ